MELQIRVSRYWFAFTFKNIEHKMPLHASSETEFPNRVAVRIVAES